MKNLNLSSFFIALIVVNLFMILTCLGASKVEKIEYLDITHKITPELPAWDSKSGVGEFIWLVKSIKNGTLYNSSEFKLSTHTGTHIDAPNHFFQDYYDQGIFDITSLNLATLHGRVLVVDAPRDKNITREALESLHIPKDVRRVLFKTLNTDRKLMHKTEFDTSFTAFTADGAEWLVRNTKIKLIGVDYLSAAVYTQPAPVHYAFLRNMRVVVVEGLNLDDVVPGYYDLQCLPLRMVRADGCPTRCILMRAITSRT